MIHCYADGGLVPFFTYLSSPGYTNNFITLQGFGDYNNGFVDNLSVSVVTPRPPDPPLISLVSLSAGELILSGTNGMPNGSYHLLWSTNVTLPLSEWMRLASHQFDASGRFILPNPVDPAQPQSFHLLETP